MQLRSCRREIDAIRRAIELRSPLVAFAGVDRRLVAAFSLAVFFAVERRGVGGFSGLSWSCAGLHSLLQLFAVGSRTGA